jgi:hypothetical protein
VTTLTELALEHVLAVQAGICDRCRRTVTLALTHHRAWIVIEASKDGPSWCGWTASSSGA